MKHTAPMGLEMIGEMPSYKHIVPNGTSQNGFFDRSTGLTFLKIGGPHPL
jgi:hypothetical protein